MNNLFYLLPFLLFFSCKNGKQEVINSEDLTPHSQNYNSNETAETKPIQRQYESMISIDTFRHNNISVDSITGFEDLFFLDRFKHKDMEKINIWNTNDSLKVWIYTYKDSLQSQNAFINWLNCFDKRCDQISLMSESYIAKDRLTIWQNNKSICVVNRAFTSPKEQMKWLNTFSTELGFQWNYQLVLQKGKSIIWNTNIDLKVKKR